MKIEITLENSYSAKIAMDGKEFQYGYSDKTGGWGFDDGITVEEMENTIGGLVIQKLCEDMSDILQGWMPEEQNADDCCWGTWEQLSEDAAEEVYDSIG
jgi:hypothetical protein